MDVQTNGDPGRRAPRVGVVLGGGAVQGAVWLEGALTALAAETGWHPGAADVLVGTSAGAWTALTLAAGVPPWLLAAQSCGERIDGVIPGPPPPPSWELRMRPGRRMPKLPGSPSLLLRAARPPWALSTTAAMTGWLPRGSRASGIDDLARHLVPTGWPGHPDLRCVACDYATGERVALTAGGPAADVADAVAASASVPGYYRPVRLDGRDYVDGGVHSASNLDLLAGADLDLVICLNPMTTVDAIPGRSPMDLLWRRIRAGAGRALADEARQVQDSGTPVLLVQPTARDIALLGTNWMRAAHHPQIIALARETVTTQLRVSPHYDLLRALPRSAPQLVNRPPGPVSGWPPLVSPPAWSARAPGTHAR